MSPPVADADSPLKNTPVKRDARLVRGRDHRAVERGRVEVRAPAGRVLRQLCVEVLSVHPDDDGAEPRHVWSYRASAPRVGLEATPAKARQSREPRAAGRDGGRGTPNPSIVGRPVFPPQLALADLSLRVSVALMVFGIGLLVGTASIVSGQLVRCSSRCGPGWRGLIGDSGAGASRARRPSNRGAGCEAGARPRLRTRGLHRRA
jgi:hypothetical protein